MAVCHMIFFLLIIISVWDLYRLIKVIYGIYLIKNKLKKKQDYPDYILLYDLAELDLFYIPRVRDS